MRRPLLFGALCGLDGLLITLAQPLNAVTYPVYVLLDRYQHVAKYGGTGWPCYGEQVWEAMDSDAEVGTGSITPRVG